MIGAPLRQIGFLWTSAAAGAYAGATAYFAIFALAPLVLIAITIAGAFIGSANAQSAVLEQFETTFGPEFRRFAEALVTGRDPATDTISIIVSGALILLGASGVFRTLREGLDRVFSNRPGNRKPGLVSAIMDQLVSTGMVLSVGFLMLASLLVSTILAAFADQIQSLQPGLQFIATVADFVLTYTLVSTFLALLVAFLPSRKIKARPAIAAGLIAGGIFVAGKYAMTLYFAVAQPASAFGAASAMVVAVLWAYYLANGLFLSAVLARVFFTSTDAGDRESESSSLPGKG